MVQPDGPLSTYTAGSIVPLSSKIIPLSTLLQAHDDLQRCGRVTSLLRAAVSNFSEVARMFSDLYTASFDADADTLARLQLLRQLNSCLSQWIEMVGCFVNAYLSLYPTYGGPIYGTPLMEYCSRPSEYAT